MSDQHHQDAFLDLLPAVARAVTRRLGDVLRPYQITAAQYSVVRLLIEVGPMTPKDISERLTTDISTIIGTITRLERDQFVIRKPSPTDGRSTVLEVSDQGRAAYSGAQPGVDEFLAGLQKPLSTGEKTVLRQALLATLQNDI
ncbi:MarR family winged helix-turn-helix transcriptional regulator [Tateyamaria pelophila]|uniref:MarR family winged helix-turn-helix transcriptional regulator n=1 Tax=Tateyamaria pelophila TaxID=328415 RepID=UPI001CBFB1CF|nr:MarR family transcriptional regulator [Tateyamaria pelophila]